jgi:23S rRNA (adenine2503-C2)-methyltransferase
VAADFRFSSIVGSHVLEADSGQTAKAVHELADGQRIESVLMRYPGRGAGAGRTTVCISSQAGCAVGCPFCATGQAGFGRQLTAGEIVDQVLHWHRDPWLALGADWRPGGGRSHYNIVFMGMGEPLNNADRVFAAVRLLNDPARLGIGARHITVSTSGVVPGIDRMIDELPQVNLAISLHAASDDLRDELVPINRKWPIAEVVAAGRRFAARTRRRVSLEYVLIDGVNDDDGQAAGLAGVASGWLCHVNLIPLNPTPGSRWSGTCAAGVRRFAAAIERAGVPVTVRDTRGREIEAACGQLHAQLAGRPMPTGLPMVTA